MTSSAPTLVRISCDTARGEVSAQIAPIGAGLHAFRVGDREVMPLDAEWTRARWFSGHTLAPWPNRMRDGVWIFEGKVLSAPANDGKGNALHGLVAQRDFAVVHQAGDSISLECLLGDDDVYPFAVRVRVTYSVDANGLTCACGARNESNRRVPFAVGTHPFFPFDDECTLTINAANVFEVDDRLIPTGRLLDLSPWGARQGEPIPMATFDVDDCFTGLARDAAGLAHTYINYPDGFVTDVWQDTGLGHTVIFTTRDFEWSTGGTKAIAIEPQTAPTNAFNTGIDLTWLAPGEESVVRWGVAFAPASL